MPDKRRHRGAGPEDERLFGEEQVSVLRRAVGDLSWLLSGGYAERSSLKLVGDRYQLTDRQRQAVVRSACSDDDLAKRRKNESGATACSESVLLIDGYNVITTIEVALGGGVILEGRDGCYRDIAGVHGTWRKVDETPAAIGYVADILKAMNVARSAWYLDRPVSNSGRLKGLILELAAERGLEWEVELVNDPDAVLSKTDEIAASSDSEILNRCGQWFNLARAVIEGYVGQAWILRLSENH